MGWGSQAFSIKTLYINGMYDYDTAEFYLTQYGGIQQ